MFWDLYHRYFKRNRTATNSVGASQVGLHLPVQETQVQSLGREDPLEKEIATHSSILAWEIPWTEEPGVTPWTIQSMEFSRPEYWSG